MEEWDIYDRDLNKTWKNICYIQESYYEIFPE